MRAPLISGLLLLVVFPAAFGSLPVLRPSLMTSNSSVPVQFQIPINSSLSLPGGEMCALPPPDDERSSLSAQFLPPNSNHTHEMPSPLAQPSVHQNNEVIGEHQTNVWVSLKDWKSLLSRLSNCVFVILFFTTMTYDWLMSRRRKQNKLNESTNDAKVQDATPKKKRARKSRNNTSSDDTERIINRREYPKIKKLNSQLIPGRRIGKLFVSDEKIGVGCNGTTVLEGTFHGRPVAVKRILKMYHDVASKEINHLMESDKHPNIVQWFGEEQDKDFVYVVLERCICNLHELILSHTNSVVQLQLTSGVLKDFESHKPNGHPSPALLKVMRDIVAGLAYLHKLGIIHRDLKPQNVLIQEDGCISAKISDMGISKCLPADMSSLISATGCGSSGWQAPEQLRKQPQARAVDLFSFGCLLFFCITGGEHPFGDVVRKRDEFIENDKKNLSLVANIPEAFDLISRLLHPEPEFRPTAAEVYNHPLFWDSEKRLSFLRDVSNLLESGGRKINPKLLKSLENIRKVVVGALPKKRRKVARACKWNRRLDETFLKNMNLVRRYNYNSVRDLLRLIRNASNHYRQLKTKHQDMLGPLPVGFESYFSSRFPKLLMEVYKVVQVDYGQEKILWKYYNQGSFSLKSGVLI